MPGLDVTDVLADPDFATTFTVTRASQTVSSCGIASDGAPVVIPNISGVVLPDRGRALQRLAEGSHLTDAVKIYTTFRLSTGAGQGEADNVNWNGANYVVVNVMDWSQFGVGFVCATADLTDLNP